MLLIYLIYFVENENNFDKVKMTEILDAWKLPIDSSLTSLGRGTMNWKIWYSHNLAYRNHSKVFPEINWS